MAATRVVKIRNQKTGVVYLYEDRPYWDKEKKRPTLERKCIGKISADGKEDNPRNLMCAKLVTLAPFYGPLYDVVKTRLDSYMSRRPYISSRFFELAEQHFKDKLDLSYYAGELKVSKVYLHQCILSTSGKAPGYWLNYYRVVYAKKCLADMNTGKLNGVFAERATSLLQGPGLNNKMRPTSTQILQGIDNMQKYLLSVGITNIIEGWTNNYSIDDESLFQTLTTMDWANKLKLNVSLTYEIEP